MTNPRRIFSNNYTQTLILISALLLIQTADATQQGNLSSQSLPTQPGSTAMISIDPVLPRRAEPFTVNVTGVWGNSCIPEQGDVTYRISDLLDYNRLYFQVNQNFTEDCRGQFEPTPFELSITIEGSDKELINKRKGLEIAFMVIESQTEFSAVKSWWRRIFDLTLGLHEIPPWIGSGYWVSEDTPYQGLSVQQQGNTVVFYELKYNRISGEPNWTYASGKFDGSTLNGVAYLVNWLSPVDGINPAFGLGLAYPTPNRLVQPTEDELLFEASSASLDVWGVNRIRTSFGYPAGSMSPAYFYKRWVFGLDNLRLPSVVPDMMGQWTLYGFIGQELKQSYEINFSTGINVGKDLYRFSSVGDEWVMECQVNLEGKGSCTLIDESLGLTMTYDLDNRPYDKKSHFNTHFNGNYAKAPLVNSNSIESDQVGILLKLGLHLPVLDLQ